MSLRFGLSGGQNNLILSPGALKLHILYVLIFDSPNKTQQILKKKKVKIVKLLPQKQSGEDQTQTFRGRQAENKK